MFVYFDVEVFIYVYLFITVAMIIFNAACILQRSGKKILLKKQKEKLKIIINNELKSIRKNKKIRDRHINYLIKKLSKISYFMAFNEIIEDSIKDDLREIYLKEIKIVFTTISQVYRKRNNTQKAYFAYMMCKYKINEEDNFVMDMMVSNVISSSTYLRENVLKALYSTGSAPKVYMAIERLSRNEIYHNPKLITDGLLSFSGEHEKLAKLFMDNFSKFNDIYKVAIVNYIAFVSESYKEKFYQILVENNESKETNIAIIRYFRKHITPKIEKILVAYVENFNEKDWEYAAVSINALISYNTKKVRETLLGALKNPNWYVRHNASDALMNLNITDDEIKKVYNSKDKYAIEILKYKLDKRRVK